MSIWIFGYGSLIWRPDFCHVQAHPGYIEGWSRRFYQGSPDHRGLPSAPGRVVTLLPQIGSRCYGMAYQLPVPQEEEILARLDEREQEGYDRIEVCFFPNQLQIEKIRVLVYIANPSNPHYLGPLSLPAMARHILSSKGPSGDNASYLYELAAALRDLQAQDTHVFQLEASLRQLEDQGTQGI